MTNTATAPRLHEAMRSAATYAGTVLVMAAGVQVALWLQTVLDASVVLIIAILAVAWFAGFWPSVLGSALATLAIDYYFTQPLYILSLDLAHLPRLIAFTLIAALFIGITARRRSAEHALKQAHGAAARPHQCGAGPTSHQARSRGAVGITGGRNKCTVVPAPGALAR